MAHSYTLKGIRYNVSYSDKPLIQRLKHMGDGEYSGGSTLQIGDDPWRLSTLIRMAENAIRNAKGDVVNIFHPDVQHIYEPKKSGNINFLTMEQGY